MSLEIKLAFSKEVPQGSCVVGEEVKDQTKYVPISVSDTTATDIFVCGIVRKLVKEGKNPIIVFNNKEEMDENIKRIYRAFDNLIK